MDHPAKSRGAMEVVAQAVIEEAVRKGSRKIAWVKGALRLDSRDIKTLLEWSGRAGKLLTFDTVNGWIYQHDLSPALWVQLPWDLRGELSTLKRRTKLVFLTDRIDPTYACFGHVYQLGSELIDTLAHF